MEHLLKAMSPEDASQLREAMERLGASATEPTKVVPNVDEVARALQKYAGKRFPGQKYKIKVEKRESE